MEHPSDMMFTEGFLEILFTEKGFYKFFFMENLKIIDAFAETDIFDGNLELVRDSDHYTTFGRTVKFGDGKLVHLSGGHELTCLFEEIGRAHV